MAAKRKRPTKFAGDRMREIRERKGFTQNELARRIKRSRATVSRFETGENSPTVEDFLSLARILDCPPFRLCK